MTAVRQRIETWFEGLGLLVYDHRWITLVLVAAFISRGILPPRLTRDAGA